MAEISARAAWKAYWEKDPKPFAPVDFEHDTIAILTRKVLDTLHIDQLDTVTFLDVGSGPGSRTIPIVGKHDNIQLILLDQSERALLLAQEYARQNGVTAQYVKADGFQMPFANGSVDCVYSIGVNEHYLDPQRQQLFDEMVRVTKPGGVVAVAVPNKHNPFHSANKWVTTHVTHTWPFGPQYDFTPRELHRRMVNAGLTDVQDYGVGAYTSWIRLLPRERQSTFHAAPTPSRRLNSLLWRLDEQTSSPINRRFGREIMDIGIKPQ